MNGDLENTTRIGAIIWTNYGCLPVEHIMCYRSWNSYSGTCVKISLKGIGLGWERFTSWYKIVFIKEWTSHWLCTNLHCTRLGDLVASPWALWESFLMPFQQFCSWLLSMFSKDWNDICIVVEWRVIYRGREHEKLWIDIWW